MRQNLKDLGRELSGGSSTTKRESDTLSRDQQGNANRASSNVYLLWLVFSERVAASRELLGKVPEIMAPPGWALVVSSPTDRAEELLNALSTIFRDQDAWKRTLSSAKGYLADVKREAERLRLIKDEQLGDDKQTQRTALKKIVSTADTTLADLTRTLEKLVVAAPAFEEVPRPPLASR